MKYRIYRNNLSMEDYLKTWKPEDLELASEDSKLDAYLKYMFKVEVFNRDDFTCQNHECKFCKNVKFHPKLTAHHVKHQRNIKEKYTGVELRKKLHNVNNGVAICESSHQAFNRYKIGLCLLGDQLPPRIKGNTYWLHRPEKINQKMLTIKGRKLRKQYKGEAYVLTTKDIPLVLLLFRFLRLPYYDIGGDYQWQNAVCAE